MNIDKIREEFPVTKNLVYFNHAAVAPLPVSSKRRVESFLNDYSSLGCVNYPSWIESQEKTRQLAATILGAKSVEIAFVKNTSTGISMVAQAIKWKEGDNIIIPETEFPANAYPWFNLREKGVKVKIVKEREGRFYPQDFKDQIDERTRLISVSWVEFASGFMNDIAAIGEICSDKGIFFCVDAIQGLGAFEMDVEKNKIDFLAADGHKWLLSPEGIGILYISRRVIEEVHPVIVGWNSVENPSDYLPYHFNVLKKDARKFEEGSPNLLGTFALGASLELLLEAGIKNVGERIIGLTDLLVEGLSKAGYKIHSPRDKGEKSGIVIFSGIKNNEVFFEHLKENKVFCALRGGGIRLSPHFYNNEDEINRVLKIIFNAPFKP